MTNNSLPEAHSQLVEGDRLEDYHTGGCMAWRLTEPDAPGLFALVTDEGGTHIPTQPDTENLIIGSVTSSWTTLYGVRNRRPRWSMPLVRPECRP